MTTNEVIELFYSEIVNEIFHSSVSEEVKESFLVLLKEVRQTVIDTCNASK